MSQGVVLSQPGYDQKGQPVQNYQMQPQTAIVQPGMAPGYGQPQQPPPGVMMGPPTNFVVPAGLPAGMAYLASLDEIKVHQILELAEVLLGWERNNRYNICNNQEQKFMFAKEDTDCCTRQMCGVMRPFVMNITDNYEQPLMRLNRPLKCQGSLFWCCCLQEMEIESPPGVLQGTVKEIWTCWIPKYQIYDAQNQVVFTVIGECCYCKCCQDVVFKVMDGETDNEVAEISKHWSGCREVFGGANDFSIKFPANMDLMKKSLLFGATFLIDFNYFEYRGNNG